MMESDGHQTSQIIVIAAVAKEDRCIGKAMGVPWHLSEDLKRFKQMTLGSPVIMGRRTFESILDSLGTPLPGRRSLVLTSRGPLDGSPDIETFTSLSAALEAVKNEDKVFISGGSQVYGEALDRDLVDRLELTIVEGFWKGDTFFPPYEHLLGTVFEQVDAQPKDGYTFETWIRRHS